jgi:hypothetical protein
MGGDRPGLVLVLGIALVLAFLPVGVSVQGQELTAALGAAFVGVDGLDEWEAGLAFVTALQWGPFWLLDFQVVERLRAFGFHAGWKLSPAWLAVGLRVLHEEQRNKTKTVWQVGARAGVKFKLVGVLFWTNELGVYLPLGERGEPIPFVALGLSLSF